MQLSVTFRHMDSTDALKEYAKDKVERIRKYFPDPISAHVTLATERGYQHVVDVLIQLHNGLSIKGHEATEDMYSSIDLVMAKIERQCRRYKEKLRNHKEHQHLGEIPVAYSVYAEPAQDGKAAQAPTKAQKKIEPPKAPALEIVKRSKFFAKPMAVEDAVMQMNLLGQSFLVFRNAGSGQVNVVYKRDDGNYGLIETGAEDAVPETAPATKAKGTNTGKGQGAAQVRS